VTRHLLTLAKLAANAALSALVLPLLLAALVFHLNPELSPGLADLAGFWFGFLLGYGLPLLVLFPLMVAMVRFFATRELRLGWFHLKSTVWFLVATIGVACVIYYFNHRLSRDLLNERDRDRLLAALSIMFICWLAATVMASLAQMKSGSEAEKRRIIALVLLAAGVPASSLVWAVSGESGRTISAAPLVETDERASVLLLGIEGATFSKILPMVSEGRLPNLGAMIKAGASGPMATSMPCRWSSAWASVSTGMLVSKHGIGELRRYSLLGLSMELRRVPTGLFMRQWLPDALLQHRPVRADDLRSAPLWAIADEMRVEAAFAGWPLAARRPRGTAAEQVERGQRARLIHRRLLGGGDGGSNPAAEADLLRAVIADLEVLDATLRLAGDSPPKLLAAYLPGLGLAGARFQTMERGEELSDLAGGVGEEYSNVLSRYYELLDRWIGELREAMPDQSNILIVSAYGTEPLGVIPRMARALAGLDTPSGVHDAGPAGVLLLEGPGVSAGRHVDDLHIADVVPLTLYLLGLPVGQDMDGRLPRRLFPRRSLNARPITFISSYG
jgi:hypothetical protein